MVAKVTMSELDSSSMTNGQQQPSQDREQLQLKAEKSPVKVDTVSVSTAASDADSDQNNVAKVTSPKPLRSPSRRKLSTAPAPSPLPGATNGNGESAVSTESEDRTQYRVGNPPHYESREERHMRIKRQFNRLERKKADGFLDSEALVGFFANVTPDEKDQQRYAQELIQLCNNTRLSRRRNNNGGAGLSSGSAQPDASELTDSKSGIDEGDEEEEDYDGRVRYADFQVFVEEKEERLWNLFNEIDHNHDNEIQPEELQASLATAGIKLSDNDLEQFIKAIDKDGDGVIDYEEWRDFLVLLPREPTLKEIFNYVQEVVAQVGVDGDVVMPPSDNDFVFRYLLAGAIAGATSRTVTAPLDRLKVYLITNSTPTLTGPMAAQALKNIPSYSSPAAPKQRLLWTAITHLYAQGGIKTFFRGNGLNIIKIAPESAIKFYTYESSKWFIATHIPSLTLHPERAHEGARSTRHGDGAVIPEIAMSGRFLAGGIAGLVSQFSIYPLETIKTRIMASTGSGAPSSSVPLPSSNATSLPSSSTPSSVPTTTSTSSTSHLGSISRPSIPNSSAAAVASSSQQLATSSLQHQTLSIRSVGLDIWQKAGLRGFYRGLGASLIGIFPYAAIDLSVFETLKFGYMRWKAGIKDDGTERNEDLERPSVFVLLACGTVSGSVGATSVYPLSLVRTRLQAQGTPQHPQTYTSALDVIRKTLAAEGPKGLYKGMVPTLTKVVPAVSLSYVTYEWSKQQLGL